MTIGRMLLAAICALAAGIAVENARAADTVADASMAVILAARAR